MSPKIAIIIASFNTEKIIKNALDSVKRQSFIEWECLIIDGGSKDGTVKILEEYRQMDSRFKYVSEKDKGIYDAFNKGWKLAKGDWIYYLGADDSVCPNAFAEVFKHNLSNYDIVFGNVAYRSPLGIIHKKSNTNISSVKKRLNCSHQGFIMRRSVIEYNGGFEFNKYKICADYYLILKSYLNGSKVKHIDTEIAVFDNTGTSGSIKTEIEGYSIRKRLHSLPYIVNLYLLVKGSCVNILRNIKYKIR